MTRSILSRNWQRAARPLSFCAGLAAGVAVGAVDEQMSLAIYMMVLCAFCLAVMRWVCRAEAVKGCGRLETLGHGSRVMCGEPFYGRVFYCRTCERHQ